MTNSRSNSPEHPLVLVIMDGIGIQPPSADNAVTEATTEVIAQLPLESFEGARSAFTSLRAHGTAVGMPSDSDMGNSEVGHNTLGAGRVIDQGAKQVANALADGSMWGPTWHAVIDRSRSTRLHFVGLLSNGNVHSNIAHLTAMIDRAAADGVRDIAVHVMLDGRDVPDHTAESFVEELESHCRSTNDRNGCNARIASGGGRMTTTMDRYEADWEIVERGWNAHVLGTARGFESTIDAINSFRSDEPGISDQYLPPFTIVDSHGHPVGPVENGDAVILFNFRGDRAVEFYTALTANEFKLFDRAKDTSDLLVAGMTLYDGDAGIPSRYLVSPSEVSMTVSEVIARAGVSQFAVAETQKFGHVTYFWNGNRSEPFNASIEEYLEIESDRVRFEERPWMKAAETADAVIAAIESGRFTFVRANLAGGDMVGHSGDIDASIVAVESVDRALQRVLTSVEAAGGTLIVTADHGNCEQMWERDDKGDPIFDAMGDPIAKTSHTLSPVPFAVIDFIDRQIETRIIENAGLANVAATILQCLGLEVPESYEPSAVIINAE